MSVNRVLKVDGERIQPGTSLFNERTGELFWYRGFEDGVVQLEGVHHEKHIDSATFYTQVITSEFVIGCQR